MRRVDVVRWIEAPPSAVWPRLAEHERLPEWLPVREVVRRRAAPRTPDGVGAVRTLKGTGWAIDERVVDFKPEEALATVLLGGAPLRDARSELQLSPDAGGTRVEWTVRFRPWLPGTGWLLERAVRRFLGRGLDGLAARLRS